MHTEILLCMYQYTKFEVTSFTNTKDIIGSKN